MGGPLLWRSEFRSVLAGQQTIADAIDDSTSDSSRTTLDLNSAIIGNLRSDI